MCIVYLSPITLRELPLFWERHIFTTTTNKDTRNTSASAFVYSLNILVKYVRMYGFDHKRTAGQFEIAWNELHLDLADLRITKYSRSGPVTGIYCFRPWKHMGGSWAGFRDGSRLMLVFTHGRMKKPPRR